jgi:DNA-binding NarL/FixJ family response regulator
MTPQHGHASEITVAIVEDDQEIAGHLAFLLSQAGGIRFTTHFSDAEQALQELPSLAPKVVLMDIQLPGITGIECVRRLKELCPRSQILMLTVYEDTENIFQSLTAGASGYLLKRTSLPELVEAIVEVHNGGSPMSSHIARKVVQFFQKPPGRPSPSGDLDQLTPREREILELLAHGDLYKEIAAECGVALDTVRKHLRSIYEKLHVRSRTQAVVKFLGKSSQPPSR